MEKLAINGGPKTKETPFGTGKRFGDAEKQQVLEALDSDILFYVFGTKVHEMEAKMAHMYGMLYCNGCSSGTAAVHIALGSLQLPPGKEVITSAVTDMGSLTGVLYQQLVPRFADIDPETYNMDAAATEALITEKTGAILVVHHAGLPVDLDAFVDIAQRHNIPLVEDCAQAWHTKYKDQLVGTFGDIAAFSLNHFKHITCGSGGLVLTNREDLEALVKLFVDKCYDRTPGAIRNPYFLAPNYQMSELQGAVASAQLDKVVDIVARRNVLGMRLASGLAEIEGIIPHKIPDYAYAAFFLFVTRVDPAVIPLPIPDFCAALAAEGIPNEPKKVTGGMATYLYSIFQDRSAFPQCTLPFASQDLGSDAYYPRGMCPNAEDAFEHTFNIPFNEFTTDEDIDDIIRAVAKVAAYYRG
jgi:dTDP-4-amino-4,6-dideoxygalactose transaminase